MNLRKELSKYNEYTCPDYLYEAWRALYAGNKPANARSQVLIQEVMQQAEFDLQERTNACRQQLFNANRRSNPKWENAKYNWSSR